MWHIATYEPVSLISLKLATATSTGGKSVLLPTPYAFKMALLNVTFRMQGWTLARRYGKRYATRRSRARAGMDRS